MGWEIWELTLSSIPSDSCRCEGAPPSVTFMCFSDALLCGQTKKKQGFFLFLFFLITFQFLFCSSSGVTPSPFLTFCTELCCFPYISMSCYIFLPVLPFFLLSTLFTHLISWERKRTKKMCLFFWSHPYPWYTSLWNKAGIQKAGFQKLMVNGSC